MQGKLDTICSILDVWGTPILLSSAFLSVAMASKEIALFQIDSSSSGTSKEMNASDVFRVVGVVAPAWAKTLDLVTVAVFDNSKSSGATEALNNFDQFCNELDLNEVMWHPSLPRTCKKICVYLAVF